MTNPEVLRHVSEKTLQHQVEQMLSIFGWASFHDLSGKTSGSAAKGFPDLVCIRGTEQLALELKTQMGRVAPEQKQWLARFQGVETSEAHIVRPSNLDWLEQRLKLSPAQLTITSTSSSASWIPA